MYSGKSKKKQKVGKYEEKKFSPLGWWTGNNFLFKGGKFKKK